MNSSPDVVNMASMSVNFFITIPHSGEQIPPEVSWLKSLDEVVVMRDVDRYVDQLYSGVIDQLQLRNIKTQWHRYVVDLNRKPEEFDADAVVGAINPSGSHPKGLHWSVTTWGEKLISQPMTMDLHEQLIKKCYEPFHSQVKSLRQKLIAQGPVYHIDAHSMPSRGTAMHADPGGERADIVVSDFHGKSSSAIFKDLVLDSYQSSGFHCAYNHPYVGGGITQMYGEPQKNFHTIQIELNRKLYMNEETKKIIPQLAGETSNKISQSINKIVDGLKKIDKGLK